MPALDFINKTADTAHDISAAILASTVAVNMGRAGLVKNQKFIVFVTAVSAADFTSGSVRRLRFYLEYTTDNGTTYHRAGAAEGIIGDTGIPLQMVEGACEVDIVPEQNAPGDIDWRITSDITATLADADDFSFQGYLGAPAGAVGVVD